MSLHNVGDEEFPTTLPKTYLDEHLYNTDRDQFPLLEAILEQFVYKFCFLILELLSVDYFYMWYYGQYFRSGRLLQISYY